MSEHYQIAIIGAGPGGLCAAAQAASRKIPHMLFERAEIGNTIFDYQLRKHVMDEPGRLPLRAPLKFTASSREEILENWNQGIRAQGVRHKRAEVTGITKEGDKFVIRHGSESSTADSVVLAIGIQGSPRKLGVPGEDLPHVAYTLADPDAFKNQDILVVGAGDAAIENALALAAQNRVSLVNRGGEFARAKDANVSLIMNAVKSGKVRCFYNTTIANVTPDMVFLNTPEGDVQVKCSHIIARLGSVLPRKFIESCGIQFPSADPATVPVVSERYESNVPGLYIIGSLIGYPLIKHAMNQGYEVIEHILGNAVEPADQILVAERLEVLGGDVNAQLARIREQLPLFKDLSAPQFRELISESTVHVLKKGQQVFARDDYGDSFFNIVDGGVVVELDQGRQIPIPAGNFFGEMGLISGRRRTATIRGSDSEKAVLLETPRKQILKLISSVQSVKGAIDRVFALRVLQTAIFPDADPAFNVSLAEKAKSKLFKKGDVLFREGDAGDVLYVIRKGSVKVSRKNMRGSEVAQTYIPAGNYVGEMALLREETQPRNATVTAVVPCETLIIEKQDFLDLLQKNPKTKERVLRVAEERRLQNTGGGGGETQFGLILDFLLKEGVSDADNVLVIDSDLCIGCDNCEKACAATHHGYSRLDRKGGQSFASIQVPIACRHCENPLCMLDCPPDALVRRPDGEVVIRDTCIGCGNCKRNCPYGVIQMVHDHPSTVSTLLSWFRFTKPEEGPAKAAKCDLCETLTGGPACVRSCPTGAALRLSPQKLESLIAEKKRTRA